MRSFHGQGRELTQDLPKINARRAIEAPDDGEAGLRKELR
jgi:hypothetical protein